MKTIRRQDALEFEFAAKPPVFTVEQGESFVIETEDAGIGEVRSEDAAERLPYSPRRNYTPALGNPMGGPVAIRGAEPGDLLEVSIERIEVDSQGFTNWGPGRTPIGNDHRWPTLNEYTVRIIEHRPGPSGTTRDGRAFLYGEPLWDLQPMIGCIGVAPEREVTTSSTGQTLAGGNLDMRDVKEGAKVYINVYHPGALLYIGDVHASQADTEYYGTADETRSEVQVSCRVIKNKRIPFIQLVFPDRIIAVRSGKSLDLMVHQAVEDMITWLVNDYGVDPGVAYMHTCVNPDFRINIYQYTLGLAAIGAEFADEVFAGAGVGDANTPANLSSIDWTRPARLPVAAGFKPASPTAVAPRHHGIPEIVRAFKTFSARKVNAMRATPGKPVWQRGFYDHVIRGERELDRVRAYIMDNPRKWSEDPDNPENWRNRRRV